MKHTATLLALALSALPLAAQARPIEIHRDAVIKITMDNTISVADSHEGDRFSATVVDDRDLPTGTQLLGRVYDVRRADGDRPGFVSLRFNRLVLPNGLSTQIEAVPIAWNTTRRDRDGRFRVEEKKTRKENYVLGGLLGGAVLGGLLDKPFEGALIGTIAGIAVAEGTDGENRRQIAARKGQTFGALLKQDLVLNIGGPRETGWDRNRDGDRNRDRDRGRDPFDRRDDRLTIAIDDHNVDYGRDEQPYRNGDTVMVPVERMARELKVDVDQANSGRVIYLMTDGTSARLELDNREYRLNGKREQLNAPIERKGDTLFVPIEVFAKIQNAKLTINGNEVRN